MFVSTGHLAPSADVERIFDDVYTTVKAMDEGENSQVYSALAAADPNQFGLCLVSASGQIHVRGDAEVPFALMSVAKPFTLALLCSQLGPERVWEELGINATGKAFNAVEPVLTAKYGKTNPMVNSGAIAACSRLSGGGVEGRWMSLEATLSAFAGRRLELDRRLLNSVRSGNFRNRQITLALEQQGALECPAEDALELYSRQSCLSVTAKDLAVMGATLANGGRNPLTGEQVVAPELCHFTLAAMATAGMYERTGEWLWQVGLPGKSGIGGGIVTVSPGKGGLGTFSPRLDTAGNSVRGAKAAALLANELGMGLFGSVPAEDSRPGA